MSKYISNLKKENKFRLVANYLQKELINGSVVDIGCRDCAFKDYLDPEIIYSGLDIIQNKYNSVNYIVNIEEGLPFYDKEFDFAIGLDVIEHTEDFVSVINEMIRVSRKGVIINIPNMAHLYFRLKFLFKGRISNKYNFKVSQEGARHKWFSTISQSDEIMRNIADKNNIKLKVIYKGNGKGKIHIYEKIASFFNFSKQLRYWSVFYVLLK